VSHNQTPWVCPECGDEHCVGHCPRCDSNKIGGGSANGMFCANCGHCWGGWNHPEIIDDDSMNQLDDEAPGTL